MNAPDLFFLRDATGCSAYRWTLTRKWGDGPMVCYIGHNPSTAGKDVEDPTTLAWQALARANGFYGYVAVNLYPFRSPDPKVARRLAQYEKNGPDWSARDALMHNEEVVVREAKLASCVVACWGAIAEDSMWIDHIIEAITTGVEPYPDIFCLGRTLAGDPKHPMARGKHRIPRDSKFQLWRKAA